MFSGLWPVTEQIARKAGITVGNVRAHFTSPGECHSYLSPITTSMGSEQFLTLECFRQQPTDSCVYD